MIAALCATATTVAQQPDTVLPKKYELTVKEAVDIAYQNVVEIKNAQIDYKLQQAKNKEILGQAMPQLNGTISANHYFQVPKFLFPDATTTAIYTVLKNEGIQGSNGPITDVPDPVLRQISFQQPWNLSMGPVTVTQLLFQPDVFVGLQARKTALEYNQALIDQAKEKIKDSVYKRYYAILITQKQLHFLDENLTRLKKLYRDDSIMYKNGFAERLDLDKVQVQINNVMNTRNILQSALNVSYSALKFALGVSQKDTVVLKDELSIDLVKQNLLDESFRYEDRPEIRTLNKVQQLQKLDIKRNKLGVLPTVALAGNYTVNAMGGKFFTDKDTRWLQSSYVGLNINVPIFSSFQRKYKIQQSELVLQKLNNTIDNVKQAIDFEQSITKESLKSALANLDLQERNLELAERVYNTTKKKFEQGLGSSFEVLQANIDYQTAQANYFYALYNVVTAKISYQYSLGKLQ